MTQAEIDGLVADAKCAGETLGLEELAGRVVRLAEHAKQARRAALEEAAHLTCEGCKLEGRPTANQFGDLMHHDWHFCDAPDVWALIAREEKAR